MVASWRNRSGRAALGCVGSIAILVVVIYLAAKLGPPWFRYQQFRDEMHTDAQFAISLPDSTIHDRLVLRADSLGLPVEARRVIIRRSIAPRVITIRAQYQERVHLFLLGDRILTFKPHVEEPL